MSKGLSNRVVDALSRIAPPTLAFFRGMLPEHIHSVYLDDLRSVCAYNRKFATSSNSPSTSSSSPHHPQQLHHLPIYNFLPPHLDLSAHQPTEDTGFGQQADTPSLPFFISDAVWSSCPTGLFIVAFCFDLAGTVLRIGPTSCSILLAVSC